MDIAGAGFKAAAQGTERLPSRPLDIGKLPPTLLGELITRRGAVPPELLLPPRVGEDAAVIQVQGGALIAASDPVTLTGTGVAAHAVLVNANDVAVTGARPRWFFCTLLLPVGTTEDDVRALFKGMEEALAKVGATLAGGHTEVTDSVKRTVVVGQMLGLREDGGFIPTGGVSVGDAILQVAPAPIEAAAVLAAEMPPGVPALSPQLMEQARAAILDPGISVVETALIAAEHGAKALHDPTEGGLSAGIHELAEASGVRLRVECGAVLWFEPGRALCRALGADPWGALASGTLLAAFAAGDLAGAQAALRNAGHATAVIARAEAGAGVVFEDGRPLPRFDRDEVARVLAPAS